MLSLRKRHKRSFVALDRVTSRGLSYSLAVGMSRHGISTACWI